MKSLTLKSIAVTVAFAATSAFGAQTGLPFEQTQFDRTLPSVASTDNHAMDASQASAGASAAASRSTFATGVWASDHSFIAPAK
jgi:hypothetical protein